MTRSKLSTKAVVLATAIGLSTAAFAGSQPAAAQSYTCPGGLAHDPAVGCSTLGGGDYGYYGSPTLLYGRQADHDHRGFDHRRIRGEGPPGGVDRGFRCAPCGVCGCAHRD